MAITRKMEEKLRRALNARRIAVLGASPEQLSIGMGPLHNLLSRGYAGEVFPVNPKYESVLGLKCYPDIESIDPPPDLAILMLNQHLAIEMTERAGKAGVGAVIIVVGGFGEVGADGQSLDLRLRDISDKYDLPVIGPNTLGFCSVHEKVTAIFWHYDALPGKIAVLSQSGGVGLGIAYCLESLHCGLSYFIGVGNRTVLDFPEYLEVLKDEPKAEVLVLFIEGVANPRSLFNSLKRAAAKKPVVVYKAGKNDIVSRATATHTGSLTGEYKLYRGMFRQAGVFEADSSREAAIAAAALSMVPPPRGNRLCALTFTAGPCIVAMDKLVGSGWELPDLSPGAGADVRQIIGEKTPVKVQNPVDLTGPGFLARTYVAVLEKMLLENFDAYLLVWSYSPLMRVPVIEVANLASRFSSKSIIMAIIGSPREAASVVGDLSARGICTYTTTEEAATALNALLARRRYLEENSAKAK